MVPVNFSVSSQGNATWVILATTNTRRRSRKILFAARGGEDLTKIYQFRAGICHHSDFFISWIQRLFSSTRLNCLVHKLILPDTNKQRGWETRPKRHTYKDHVCLDRLFFIWSTNFLITSCYQRARSCSPSQNHTACVYQPEDQWTPEITRSQTAACKPTIPCLPIQMWPVRCRLCWLYTTALYTSTRGQT